MEVGEVVTCEGGVEGVLVVKFSIFGIEAVV